MERRGYFFVDQAATGQEGKTIRLNFIPDGKTKNMSSISHKLDAKEIAGGKGKADGANRAEAKKLADGAAVNGDAAAGEEVKLSKSELKKQAKKAEKKAAKAGGEESKEGAEAKKAAHQNKGAPKVAASGVQLIVSTSAKHSDSGVDT